MRRWLLLLAAAAVLLAVWVVIRGDDEPECKPPPRDRPARAAGFDLSYPHHPSELLVGYPRVVDPDTEPGLQARRDGLFEKLKIKKLDFLPRIRVAHLALPRPGGDEALLAAARELERHEDLFVYVDPNRCVYLEQQATPDPKRSEQWALDRIEAPAAWTTSPGSQNVVVAVIDSGIDLEHPDLKTRLWTKNGLHGWNVVDDNSDIQDKSDHGSQMAGVIGAVHMNGACIQGIDQDVRLMVLKAFVGSTGDVAHVTKALQYATEEGAHVVNASWSTDQDGTLYLALADAGSEGIVVAAAAGHGGASDDLDSNPSYPCSSGLSNVICVAATTKEADELDSSSSWGVKTVRVGAPGEGIYSTATSQTCKTAPSSPSIATPHVTGVVALIRAKFPNATPSEIATRIDCGDNIPALQPFIRGGNRLNARLALEFPCAATPPTPPSPPQPLP